MIRDLIKRLLTPSYDQLINRANHETHLFHLLKYKNYDAANVHRKRAIALQQQAAAMKKSR